MLGDFNEILWSHEKEGGQPRPQICMDRFRLALEDCKLCDLGYMGDTFTWWNNSHNCDQYIRERLDRAVADDAWQAKFPEYCVRNGDPHHSDHRPIIVTIDKEEPSNGPRSARAFRFEVGWVQEENYGVIVENAWKLTMEARGGMVMDAVLEVAAELCDWSSNFLGDLEKHIKRLKKELERCRKGSIGRDSVARLEILKYRLEKLEDQRELYWRQRATSHWLKHGDRNTGFFHVYASERRRRNKIKKLVKDDGGVAEDTEGIKALVTNFYRSLFCSNAGSRFEELLQHVPSRVTAAMNADLLAEFTDEEIKRALDGMGDLKAPGPDGMPALFTKSIGKLLARMLLKR